MERDDSWYTKEDVLKHFGSTGLQDFDDDYIVRGDNPPPTRHIHEEDDEFLLRFGALENQNTIQNVMLPDLQGITEMLRRVQDDNDIINSEKPDDTLMVISKLDPNVEEFVPRKVCVPVSSSIVTQENDIASASGATKISEVKKENENSDNNMESENIIPNGSSENNKDNEEEERKKLTMSLRTDILEASKCNTMQQKWKRNVAIAALMKLNSTPSDSNPSKITPPSVSPKLASPFEALRLCTPEYFEVKKKTLSRIPPNVSEHIDIEEQIDTEPQINSEKASLNDHIDDNALQSNSEVQESIKKVNSWLQKGEKKPESKSPVVHFGPVSFKKKGSSTPLPVEKPKPEPVVAPKAYVFSDYASELAKTYEDRKKKIETNTVNKMDIWEKLEYDLKKRDEVVKERLIKQNDKENQYGDDNKPHKSSSSKSSRRC